jgi:photosystem II stability/assembly factor-like uncharacterized protein
MLRSHSMACAFHAINKFFYMKTRLILIILAYFFVSPARAQWMSNGPFGGPAHSVIVLGGTVFAGTDNGVFKSTDMGQNWTGTSAILQGKSVRSLIVCDTVLFAGVNYNGVYRSSDNGATWTQSNSGMTDVSFNFLFCSSDGIYNSTPDGTYFSSDGGNSWSFANNGIPSTYIIYSYAEVSDTVYGGTYGLGLYKTTNNGVSWTSVGGGFPASSFVYALLANGNTVYAGTSSGVYKSADGGVTWFSSNSGFPASMWANNFSMASGIIYAGTYSEGIFKSTDNGGTWAQVNNGIPDLPFNTGLPHNYPAVQSIFAVNGNVFAATFDGMYASSNQAITWAEANNGIRAADLSWISANNTTVFAGSDFTGMYTSSDNGTTWSRSNNGLTAFGIITVYAGNDAVFLSAQNEKAFVSTNEGSTWTNASSGLPSNPKMFQSDSQRVLTITQGAQFVSQKLFETSNNGGLWTEIPTTFLVMNALAFEGNDIYVGSDSGRVYYTNTNGSSWIDIGTGLPDVYVNTLFKDGTTLYAGTEAGLFKTVNNGSNWSLLNNGLPVDTVNDVLVSGSAVYASSPGNGVYVSNNAGTSWTAVNNGLDNLSVVKLASDDNNVYAATRSGMYTMSLSSNVNMNNIETEFLAYPNPSDGDFTLKCYGLKSILVEVFSVTGQVVYRYSGNFNGSMNIDMKQMAKGVYIVNVVDEHVVQRKKMVIK